MKSLELPIINQSNSTFTKYTLVTSTNELFTVVTFGSLARYGELCSDICELVWATSTLLFNVRLMVIEFLPSFYLLRHTLTLSIHL